MTEPTPSCPKCGAPRSGESCPKCGLVYDRFRPGCLDESVPAPLVALWDNVVAEWSDRGAHATFVEHALRSGHAGYAAACYRRRGDDPLSKEQLERLTARLMVDLDESRTRGPLAVSALRRRFLAGFLVAAAVVLVLILLHSAP